MANLDLAVKRVKEEDIENVMVSSITNMISQLKAEEAQKKAS